MSEGKQGLRHRGAFAVGKPVVLEEMLPIEPDGTIQTASRYPRPQGVLWEELGEKLDEIPVLQQMTQRR